MKHYDPEQLGNKSKPQKTLCRGMPSSIMLSVNVRDFSEGFCWGIKAEIFKGGVIKSQERLLLIFELNSRTNTQLP